MTWQPKTTAVVTVAVAVAAVLVLGIGWGVLEAYTVADNVPGNHITAVWRELWARQPGAILLVLLAATNFLSFVLGYIGGHIFWGQR